MAGSESTKPSAHMPAISLSKCAQRYPREHALLTHHPRVRQLGCRRSPSERPLPPPPQIRAARHLRLLFQPIPLAASPRSGALNHFRLCLCPEHPPARRSRPTRGDSLGGRSLSPLIHRENKRVLEGVCGEQGEGVAERVGDGE
eukprot:scaffold95215_cov26-Tisochrysis_lutea.AAC.1